MTLAPALLWLGPVFDDLSPSANVTALGLLTMPAHVPPAPLPAAPLPAAPLPAAPLPAAPLPAAPLPPAPGGTNPSSRKR